MPESLLDDDHLSPIVSSAPLASVAVDAKGGPHVTPQVFAAFGGRLWMATPHTSVKARVLRRRPEVGLLLRGEDATAIIAGEAEVLDAAKPWSLLGAATETAMTGPASAVYALRNLDELRSLVTDALTLKLGPSALVRRVIVAVRPVAVTVVDGAGRVVRSEGWPEPARPAAPAAMAATPAGVGLDLADLPDAAAELVGTAGPAALGWPGPAGPLALPVSWEPEASTAALDASLAWMLAGRASAPACVTIDESDRRMSETVGVVLRGVGTVDAAATAPRVDLAVDRAAWWAGVDSGSS